MKSSKNFSTLIAIVIFSLLLSMHHSKLLQKKPRNLKDDFKKKKKMKDGRRVWLCKVKGGTTKLVGFDNISKMSGK